jgi:hypothetical protein
VQHNQIPTRLCYYKKNTLYDRSSIKIILYDFSNYNKPVTPDCLRHTILPVGGPPVMA